MKWNYEQDIDYWDIQRKNVENDEFLFYLVTFASFIEIASDTYSKTLSVYFANNEDNEISSWLNDEWENEEIQHGNALKKYVQTIWPNFDWKGAYGKFSNDYLPLCTVDNLQQSKAKEMLARMIIETGTSTFYKAMEAYANDIQEPVLQKIAHLIHKDEIQHYGHFSRHFTKYNKEEKNTRTKLIKVIYQRLIKVDSEDIFLAYRAIYYTLNNGAFQQEAYKDYKSDFSRYAKKYYPFSTAIKMILQPLNLSKSIESSMIPPIRGAMRIVGF